MFWLQETMEFIDLESIEDEVLDAFNRIKSGEALRMAQKGSDK